MEGQTRAHDVQVDLVATAQLQKKRIALIQKLNALLHRMEGRHFAKKQAQTP